LTLRHVVAFITISFLLLTLRVSGQNNPFYDYSRKYHFGFMLGTAVSTFKYKQSSEFWSQDSISNVSIQRFPGITLGAVADLHLGEYFDLRLIPTLVLSQRNITFTEKYANTETIKQVESALVEVPLLLKFKSVRHADTRIYVIGGFKYSYDLSSDSQSKRNPADPKIFLKPNNYSYEFGTGFDFYFKYFKFSPELKMSRGLNNVLQPDTKIYSRIFDGFRSNIFYLSFYFEG